MTPQTEEKYKKIDEEFDKMMQTYRLAVSNGGRRLPPHGRGCRPTVCPARRASPAWPLSINTRVGAVPLHAAHGAEPCLLPAVYRGSRGGQAGGTGLGPWGDPRRKGCPARERGPEMTALPSAPLRAVPATRERGPVCWRCPGADSSPDNTEQPDPVLQQL